MSKKTNNPESETSNRRGDNKRDNKRNGKTEDLESRQQWLTLGEASKYLGVHYSTLRSWSDSGDVAVFRTPGGHRRFNLNDLRRFLSDRARTDLATDSNELVDAAVGRVRQQIQQMPHRDRRWLESQDDVEVTNKPGLSPAELAEIVGEYDGMIVRSGAKVTAEVLANPGKLRGVARAGCK